MKQNFIFSQILLIFDLPYIISEADHAQIMVAVAKSWLISVAKNSRHQRSCEGNTPLSVIALLIGWVEFFSNLFIIRIINHNKYRFFQILPGPKHPILNFRGDYQRLVSRN